jgi:hypothetical protein
VATAEGYEIQRWDAHTGVKVGHPMVRERPVTHLAFAAGGKVLAEAAGSALIICRQEQ